MALCQSYDYSHGVHYAGPCQQGHIQLIKKAVFLNYEHSYLCKVSRSACQGQGMSKARLSVWSKKLLSVMQESPPLRSSWILCCLEICTSWHVLCCPLNSSSSRREEGIGRWKGEGLESNLIRPALLLWIPWQEAPGTQGHGHSLCMAMLRSESVFGPDHLSFTHQLLCSRWRLVVAFCFIGNTKSSVLECSSVLDTCLVHCAEQILNINKIKVYKYSSVLITQIKQR